MIATDYPFQFFYHDSDSHIPGIGYKSKILGQSQLTSYFHQGAIGNMTEMNFLTDCYTATTFRNIGCHRNYSSTQLIGKTVFLLIRKVSDNIVDLLYKNT